MSKNIKRPLTETETHTWPDCTGRDLLHSLLKQSLQHTCICSYLALSSNAKLDLSLGSMHCSKHGTEYVSGDDCHPVCLELDDDKWDGHFMADITGAQGCNNEDEEGRSDIESDKEDQVTIPQLRCYKEAIASLEQVQHFLECHGMNVEANALSSTVGCIAAVAINAKIQTILHDYFISLLFSFLVVSHIKIVILTHIERDEEVKSKIHC